MGEWFQKWEKRRGVSRGRARCDSRAHMAKTPGHVRTAWHPLGLARKVLTAWSSWGRSWMVGGRARM